MPEYTKRDATPEETEEVLKVYDRAPVPAGNTYRERQKECEADGLKTEVCSCGKILPAFVHFVRCDVPKENCPMKGTESKSLLDHIFGDDEEEPKQ